MINKIIVIMIVFTCFSCKSINNISIKEVEKERINFEIDLVKEYKEEISNNDNR